MTRKQAADAARTFQTLFHLGTLGGLTDEALVGRFADRREGDADAAFAALVERHGPMVLRVCRGVLGDAPDAHDAFQATFLVLARRAGAIRNKGALAGWLYGVAYRVSLKAKTAAARRRRHEGRRAGATPERVDPAGYDDAGAAVLQEVNRLPEKYRVPVVLCYLEGLTREEAARRLGWPPGTVQGRLARAKDLLRARLSRRGVGLPAGVLAATLSATSAEAAVPAALARSTLDAAARFAGGASTGLARTVLQSLAAHRLTGAAAVLATLLVVTAGVVTLRPRPNARPVRRGAALRAEPLPPGAVARLGSTRFLHGTAVYQVAYLPAGRGLVSLGLDGAARVWDADTGRERRRLGPEDVRVRGAALTPDGRTAALLETNGAVRLTDPATGRELRRVEAGAATVFLGLSADGKTLATGGPTLPAVAVRDAATGRTLREIPTPPPRIRALAVSPDGRVLVACANPSGSPPGPADREPEGGTVWAWDTTTGTVLYRTPRGAAAGAVAFAPDGRTVAAALADGTVRSWDAATGAEVRRFDAGGREAACLAFAPDGKTLATGDGAVRGDIFDDPRETSAVHLWDVASGRELRRWVAHPATTHSVAFAPDGAILASSGDETVVRLWNVASGREVRPPEGHHSGIGGLAYGPDGSSVITGGRDGTVRFWDPSSGTQRGRWDRPGDPIQFLSLSADGRLLATGGGFRPSRLWDVASGRELRRFEVARHFTPCGALSPDGKSLATGGDQARLWDTATGRERVDLSAASSGRWLVKDVGFSPDSALLAATDGAVLLVRDTARGAILRRVELPAGSAPGGDLPFGPAAGARVLFSPDGSLLAAAGDRAGVILLLDAASGEERARLPGDQGTVKALAFSPDGRILASGLSAGPGRTVPAVRLWDVAERREIGRVEAHRDPVSALAFSPDGSRLASASEDATALIWDVAAIVGRGKTRSDTGGR